MAKNKMRNLVFVALAILLGCHEEPNFLKVKESIKVYKDYDGDQKEVIFVLSPGDECKILKKRIAKVYAYYQVSCPGKGSGWVELGEGYQVYSK